MTEPAVARLDEIEEIRRHLGARDVRAGRGGTRCSQRDLRSRPPGIRRTAFARTAGTTVLAIGAGPAGQPYQPSGWELFAPLMPLFAAGKYAEGADRAQGLIANDPPYGAVYYNTACLEAQAGRTDAALGHLRRALELSPSMAEFARTDDDLAALRGRPGFEELLGG